MTDSTASRKRKMQELKENIDLFKAQQAIYKRKLTDCEAEYSAVQCIEDLAQNTNRDMVFVVEGRILHHLRKQREQLTKLGLLLHDEGFTFGYEMEKVHGYSSWTRWTGDPIFEDQIGLRHDGKRVDAEKKTIMTSLLSCRPVAEPEDETDTGKRCIGLFVKQDVAVLAYGDVTADASGKQE